MIKLTIPFTLLLLLTSCMHLTLSGECESEMKKDFIRYQSMNQCLQEKQEEQRRVATAFSAWGNGYQQSLEEQKRLRPNGGKQTDLQCVNDCTASGYSLGLCNSKCSY
jgi:hypothetical protein